MAAPELRLLDEDIPADPEARPLALFDLDGTLTDPADGILACHRWALAEAGYPLDPSLDTRSMIGPPAEELYATLGVPDHEMIYVIREILRVVPIENLDSAFFEKGFHRIVDVSIRSSDTESGIPESSRNRTHCRAANPHEIEVSFRR